MYMISKEFLHLQDNHVQVVIKVIIMFLFMNSWHYKIQEKTRF